MNENGERQDGCHGVGEYLPAQLNTTGELAILLAALPADMPLQLGGTIRVDPATATTGYGTAVAVASIGCRYARPEGAGPALRLSLMVVADPGKPPSPESGYPLNPLDRLHEAVDHRDDIGEATAAATETLNRLLDYLTDHRYPARVGQVVDHLQRAAEHLVEETTLIELEKDI